MRRVLPSTLLALCLCPVLRGQEAFRELFNGKDLSGWAGDPSLWSVEDGAITGRTSAEQPIKSNTFLIWKAGEVADFQLELEYRLTAGDEKNPGGNSGIQYRSRVVNEEKFIVGGYQADIDLNLTYSGINYEERGRGILAQRGERVRIASDGEKTVESIGDAAELGKKIHAGQWNRYRIVAKGNQLSHYINDVLMSETIDDQATKAAERGVLAFQIHTGPPMVIQFKHVRLKKL
ncbi:MAG: DUF1080 domain-containing protein [Pirellulaceae bacterium]|nr:DUF1080 domain-containing protein [Pirellulaceae bacterium]